MATQWVHDKNVGTAGSLPHAELNYGAAPNVQLHLLVPMVYSAPHDSSSQYGLGDIEVGVKYRFIQEQENGWRPQVGIFPIAVLPSGDSSRGLGDRRIRIFLPLWLQKNWGPWTTYGGGCYWYHLGNGNRNYWFAGWLLQRELSNMLTLGAEIFNTSPKSKGGSDETAFNVGGFLNLNEEHHILFSAGRDIKASNALFAYFAFQWTFGPHEEKR